MVAGQLLAGMHALRSTQVAPSHRDGGAALVDKDQVVGREGLDACPPRGSGFGVLLGCCYRPFLRVQPTRAMARYIVLTLTVTP